MKTLKTSFALLCALFVLFLLVDLGCSKNRIQAPSLNAYSSPNTYLNSKKQPVQTFIIDSGGTCPLVGNQGTSLCVAKTCLMLPNGDSIYFPYTLQLIEIYTPRDMIYAQMPTVAAGSILETAGEISVRTFKNGTELSLRSGCSYTVKMLNAAPQNYMQAYYGVANATFVDWTNNPSSLGITTNNIPVFSNPAGGYTNSIVKLGWLNCDFNRGSSSNSNLTFISSTDQLTNLAIFVYFPSTKTVMQVYNTVSGAIPNGSNVKIIVIGVNASGQLYKFYTTQTVNSSQNVEVTMSSISDADLTTLLNGL